ncbi:MAG TPA: heme-binding domain-containing protein [Sphingomicrobium sp.]|nr:heme-binding domain-containing protein [Sphingomicrobium sp.]
MKRALKLSALIILGLLVAAQFVRPSRLNPATSQHRTIEAQLGKSNELVAVLDRSCNECHSNSTVWPSYTGIAPLSWIAVRGIKEARQVVNFSEWASYSPEQQQQLLEASCAAASAGRMPGSFATSLKLAAPVASDDINAICAASRGERLASLEKRQ